jgi:shikimate dehydrogenase
MLPGRLILLGHPVSHSLSPRFQNAALRAAAIPLEYTATDVTAEHLDETLRLITRLRAAGNVTVPHKEAVYARCANLTPIAERVGAVNTFWVEGDALVGDNTDVGGFDAAFRLALGAPGEDACVAVLGAGGGAAAVLAAVERWPGARAIIASRTVGRASALAARFDRTTEVVTTYREAVARCTIVVNATPIGLEGDQMPVDPIELSSGTRVMDLAYRRGGTPWVIRARSLGLLAADGLGMLIEQGALSFSRWFGIEPDRKVMWDAVRG